MKWDRLRLFNIVAQTRNITEASYILQMSQSALSRQMKALENELGVRLLSLIHISEPTRPERSG